MAQRKVSCILEFVYKSFLKEIMPRQNLERVIWAKRNGRESELGVTSRGRYTHRCGMTGHILSWGTER